MNSSFDESRTGTGTREWSDASYNICTGCEHGCLYCYAKAYRARFDEAMRVPGNWEAQKLRPGSKLGADVRSEGVIMFPTTHDLTPAILPEAVKTIRNLIAGGNELLIVSKPHLSVVSRLCHEFRSGISRILFRFTIGALDESLCSFWEPGAPPANERLNALKFAFAAGFRTSVSCEPMLGGVEETVAVVNAVAPYVTDTVWIGKMQRVPAKLNAHVQGFAEAREKVRRQQTDEEILRLIRKLHGTAKVRWKDSIVRVMQNYHSDKR